MTMEAPRRTRTIAGLVAALTVLIALAGKPSDASAHADGTDNRPPRFTGVSTEPVILKEGLASYTAPIQGDDPDFDRVTISLVSELPPGAVVEELAQAPYGNSNQLTVRWRPALGQVGRYVITYRATDEHGLSVTHDDVIDVLPDVPPYFITSEEQCPTCRFSYPLGTSFSTRVGEVARIDVMADDPDQQNWGDRVLLLSVMPPLPPFAEFYGCGGGEDPAPNIHRGYSCAVNFDDDWELEARGSLVWAPRPGDEGTYTIVAFARDWAGAVSTLTITMVVEGDNRPPIARAGGDRVVRPGDVVTLDASASTDPDGDALTFEWVQTAGPAIGLGAPNSVITSFVAPRVADVETLTFEVRVRDGRAMATDRVNVTVEPLNRPPVITPADGEIFTVRAGTFVIVGVSATDPDGDAVTLTATTLPAVAVFDPGGRQLAWQTTGADIGSHSATFTAVDEHGATTSSTITIVVEGVRVRFVRPQDGDRFSVAECGLVGFELEAVCPECGDIDIALRQESTPRFSIFSQDRAGNPAHAIFAWFPDPHTNGTYTVSFAAVPASAAIASASLSVTVEVRPDKACRLREIGDFDQDGIQDRADLDPLTPSNDFASEDGSTVGHIGDRGDQLLTIQTTADGTGIRITSDPDLSGDRPATVEACFIGVVGGGAGIIREIRRGTTLVIHCGSITVAVLAGSVEMLLRGRNGSIVATAVVTAGNSLTFDPATFSTRAARTNRSDIVLSFDGPDLVLVPGTEVVVNRPPVVVLEPAGAVLVEGDTLISTGTFRDDTTGPWTAAVDYGDGSGVVPLEVSETQSFLLTHRYDNNGTFRATVTVTDRHGASGIATLSVSVTNAAPIVEHFGVVPGPLAEGTPVAFTATFADAGRLDRHTALWAFGDGTGATMPVPPGERTVQHAHTFVNDGVYTVQLTIVDDDGAAASQALTVTIANRPPAFDPALGDHAAVEGVSFTLRVEASDPSPLDTVTLRAVELPDGARFVLDADTPPHRARGTVTWKPTCEQSGRHEFTFAASDDDGGVTIATVMVTVAEACRR